MTLMVSSIMMVVGGYGFNCDGEDSVVLKVVFMEQILCQM